VDVDFGPPAGRKSLSSRPSLSSGTRVPSQSPGPGGSRFSRPSGLTRPRSGATDDSLSGSSPARASAGFRTPVANPRLSKQFEEGEDVKVKKKDLPGYEDARIVTKHSDGTYDVRYDRNGRDERRVLAARVARRPTADSSSSAAAADEGKVDSPQYRMGQKVEAMYRGRGSYLPATVLSVNSRTGKMDIKWEDGMEERDGMYHSATLFMRNLFIHPLHTSYSHHHILIPYLHTHSPTSPVCSCSPS
jgi:hypothetical protein